MKRSADRILTTHTGSLPPDDLIDMMREKENQRPYDRDAFTARKRAMMGATLAPPVTLVCTGPVKYIGHAAVQHDIANLKEGLQGQVYEEALMPSANPLSLVGIRNEYYRTQDEFEEACIDATREEYQAIIDAGFILQVDDPGLGTSLWGYQDLAEPEKQLKAGAPRGENQSRATWAADGPHSLPQLLQHQPWAAGVYDASARMDSVCFASDCAGGGIRGHEPATHA